MYNFEIFQSEFFNPLKRNVQFFHPPSSRSSKNFDPLTCRPPPTAWLKITNPLSKISYNNRFFQSCVSVMVATLVAVKNLARGCFIWRPQERDLNKLHMASRAKWFNRVFDIAIIFALNSMYVFDQVVTLFPVTISNTKYAVTGR